jgi:hypothetical protein
MPSWMEILQWSRHPVRHGLLMDAGLVDYDGRNAMNNALYVALVQPSASPATTATRSPSGWMAA